MGGRTCENTQKGERHEVLPVPPIYLAETAWSQEGDVPRPGQVRAIINDAFSFDVQAEVFAPNRLVLTGHHVPFEELPPNTVGEDEAPAGPWKRTYDVAICSWFPPSSSFFLHVPIIRHIAHGLDCHVQFILGSETCNLPLGDWDLHTVDNPA